MNIAELVTEIRGGDRRALARGITLIESSRADHRCQSLKLMELLHKASGSSIRIGLTGAPGSGKSTFIESLGMMLIGKGLRVMVLAIDPSSAYSGGSILGDKTRMDRLSREHAAFVRPSPNNTVLGGVAWRTREAVVLGQAAGFDVIIVETVGVGQSETVVSELSDIFLLLIAPASGDELQGVKRGIMELADLVLINKADGDLELAATRTCADYASALRLLRKRPGDADGFPKAVAISALEERGLENVWSDIESLTRWRQAQGLWDQRRAGQLRYWFEEELRQQLLAQMGTTKAKAELARVGDRVALGELTPMNAVEEMMTYLRSGSAL